MQFDRKQLLLYAITDRACIGQRGFDQAIEKALTGGVTMLQLREKNLSDAELIAEAKRIKAICARYHVPLIINDNYRAAIAAGADGVHVGITDAPVTEIRKTAGDDFIIGATAKTVEQARLAEESGADYLGVGAVFPSPTKTDALRITPAQFREIARSVTIPAVAIGGITEQNLPELTGIGATGFAVVSAVFAADDITARCRQLKALASGIVSE